MRVSIVLKDASTLAKGYSSEDIATNSAAMKYRQKLETKQEKMAKTISKKALGGEALDVVWNLTLAANIISANVEYGQIEKIEKISGVEAVLIETRYEPCVVKDNETTDPNMATSSNMIGSNVAWADGYTGAGSKVAIIDTGADTDHPSLNGAAYSYAVKGLGITPVTAADYADKLEKLNAFKKNGDLKASDLYVSAKIPFGFNYIDADLDVTHDNDSEGDHGSHVTGIAAGNRYIEQADGSFAPALDTALTQGVAPDAQVFVMKVFGTNGGAKDSDYMAAIEDAILLGCDSINLSLGSSYAGFACNTLYQSLLDSLTEYGAVITMSSRNSYAAYQAIMENITNSGTVVSISAGNSGNWFENTANGYPYAESNSWTTTGSPGSYTNSLGVASVDNVGGTGDYVEVAGKKLFYTDTTSAPIQPLTTLAGEQQFVYVDTAGNAEDFAAVKEAAAGSNIKLGAQNVHFAKSGAYTGELSADMLKACGVEYVVIGHSERRQYFGETDKTVNQRTRAAVAAGLVPIICVGELKEERENGYTDALVEYQTLIALNGLTNDEVKNAVIAYEPVWAIGTGLVATDEQANETIGVIRKAIERKYGREVSDAVRIQYGGSMNPGNVKGLMAQPEIDGGLIGGASLKAPDFTSVVMYNK